METLQEIISLLLYIIRIFTPLSIIVNLITIVNTTYDTNRYKKRIINTIIFYILAESIYIIKDVISNYFIE